MQAVSALIDIFSDETLPYDVNFRQGRYLDALVRSVEGVRRAVRGIDRKKERELRVRGEEVRDNLVAFIQYRRGLGGVCALVAAASTGALCNDLTPS